MVTTGENLRGRDRSIGRETLSFRMGGLLEECKMSEVKIARIDSFPNPGIEIGVKAIVASITASRLTLTKGETAWRVHPKETGRRLAER